MQISNGVNIRGLQKLTLIDYPGKLACTVFFAGCTFRCPWCYSKELVLPEEIKKQPIISQKKLFKFLKERKGLLQGVVLCGGEPTAYPRLPSLIKKIKNLGYAVKLDTNGSNPKMLKKLLDKCLIDYAAMDIKAPLKNIDYNKFVGVDMDLKDIFNSVVAIKNSEIDYEFRTTVVPTVHSKADIVQMAKDISPAKKYFLQNFRPEKTIEPGFENIKPYSDEELLEMQKAIAPFFDICQIR